MTPEKKVELLKSYLSILKLINDLDISDYSATTKIPYPMNIFLTDMLLFKSCEIMKECGIETVIDFQEPKPDIIKSGTHGHMNFELSETSILNQILES